MRRYQIGAHYYATFARWYEPWEWDVWYDGRWALSRTSCLDAWTLLIGPYRVSNVRIRPLLVIRPGKG